MIAYTIADLAFLAGLGLLGLLHLGSAWNAPRRPDPTLALPTAATTTRPASVAGGELLATIAVHLVVVPVGKARVYRPRGELG